MILRLCLRIGLLSPWTSFAVANDPSRRSINIYRHIFTSTCDINVHIPSTNLLQELSPLFTQIGRWYGQEDVMSTRNEFLLPTGGSCRRLSDVTTDTENAVNELRHLVEMGDVFNLDEKQYVDLIYRAFITEIRYLKTAWVAPVRSSPRVTSLPPSDYLFGTRYGEVDRTLTGINALRWIFLNDYDSYTQNQPVETKLSWDTFQEMRQLFQRYNKPQAILTLIMMQMTNDLGKSEDLKTVYHQRLPPGYQDEEMVNHDMMMYHVARDVPDLVPSFQRPPVNEQSLVRSLLCVSAEFNPAQLVQGECPPEAMMILQEQDWRPANSDEALDRKFLELILDLSGALGQIDHEGAMTMTEPVVRSFLHALRISKCVARYDMTPYEAYHQVLEHRLQILRDADWDKKLDIRTGESDFAKVRLFCMGRVDTARKATFFSDVYDDLPSRVRRDLEWGLRIDHAIARQATYMPGMIANCNTADQLSALLSYLARVLFLSQSDLDTLGRDSDDVVIVERDVFWTIGSIVKSQEFKDHPFEHVNEETPLPKVQVLKRSANVRAKLIGDEYHFRNSMPRYYDGAVDEHVEDSVSLHPSTDTNYRDHFRCSSQSTICGDNGNNKVSSTNEQETMEEKLDDEDDFELGRSQSFSTDASLVSPVHQHHNGHGGPSNRPS